MGLRLFAWGARKARAELRKLAQEHGPAAIGQLAHLMGHAQSESVRVAAIRELLERGYGKASGDEEESENPLEPLLSGLGAILDEKLERLAAGEIAEAAKPTE